MAIEGAPQPSQEAQIPKQIQWGAPGSTKATEWGLPGQDQMLCDACASGIQVERTEDGFFTLYDENFDSWRQGIPQDQLQQTIEEMSAHKP